MKLNRFTVVVSLSLAKRIEICVGLLLGIPKREGVGGSIDAHNKPACSSHYVNLETYDGNISIKRKDIINNQQGRIRRCQQGSKQEQNQIQQQQTLVQPIQIVRRYESPVEFIRKNSTFFPSVASSVGYIDIDNINEYTISPLQKVFTVFPIDVFGSEHCHSLHEGPWLLDDDASTSRILKANCGNTQSSTLVTIFVGFIKSEDNTKQNKILIPECCLDNPNGSSSSKTIKYVFKLMCSPTSNNHDEHMDESTRKSTTANSSAPTEPIWQKLNKDKRVGPTMPIQ